MSWDFVFHTEQSSATKMKNFVSAIREGLAEQMKFTKWDLLLVIFDNIGFKCGGSAK